MQLLKRLVLIAGLVSIASALPNVTRNGKYLYREGARFYVKGVAYQPQGTLANDPNNPFPEPSDFVDPLADPAGCTRDLPFLEQLGVNVIRVYSVSSSLNHDLCMHALSNAGIYTIIDLSLPVNGSIDRAAPAWSTNILDLYINTINGFLQYGNVLAFNVGNEVVSNADKDPSVTAAAAYIKAAARDVKAYIKSRGFSTLVAYASTDGPGWLDSLARYMGCGSEATSIDLFGLNNYEWCGDSTFQASYAAINARFSDLNIPTYFSEFGCVSSPPRLWTEVQALFGSQMSLVWSGGLAFSYFAAQGGYGMTTLSSDNKTVTTSDDFKRLQAQYANVTFINSPSQSDAGQTQFPACQQPSSTFLASTFLPPTPNDAACGCLAQNSFSCKFIETNSPGELAVIGSLLDTGCSLLGQQGASCSQIAGSGSSGVYGAISFCDPVTKLDYVFSSYYDITRRNPQSCNFAGNATVVPNPPATSAVAPAESSCLSNTQATFTPTAPATTIPVSGGSKSSASSSAHSGNAAESSVYILGETHGTLGVFVVTLVAVAGGFWTIFA